MKKTYIQPSIEAVKIQLSHMVMTSGDPQPLSSTPVGGSTGNSILSKRGDFVEIEFDED